MQCDICTSLSLHFAVESQSHWRQNPAEVRAESLLFPRLSPWVSTPKIRISRISLESDPRSRSRPQPSTSELYATVCGGSISAPVSLQFLLWGAVVGHRHWSLHGGSALRENPKWFDSRSDLSEQMSPLKACSFPEVFGSTFNRVLLFT